MFAEQFIHFYQQTYPELRCLHSSLFYFVGDRAGNLFCGLCWLQNAWEAEAPSRFHEYKLLAENGNPETAPRFWAHLKANLGLIPPDPEIDLNSYRLARKRLYGVPSKKQYPITAALYEIMGVQPKLATPLVLFFCGASMDQIRAEMKMTTYGLHQSMAKGMRMIVREIS